MSVVRSTAKLYDYTIVSNEEIAVNVYQVVIKCPELARTIKPGQFFNLKVPGDERELLRIPLSFSEWDPEAGTVTAIYQIMGRGTERLSRLPLGTVSDLVGPAGNGWHIRPGTKHALLIGGGLGVAPLMPFAKMLADEGIPFDFVIGATSESRLYGVEYLESVGARSIGIATDDGSCGIHGFCTSLSQDMLSDTDIEDFDLVATCGPYPMMKIVAQQAHDAKVHCLVSMEKGMMCGFGACGSCVVDTVAGPKACCIAGPVFNAKGVNWDA